MRRLTITAIALAMLVAVPAQATEPADFQGAAAALAQPRVGGDDDGMVGGREEGESHSRSHKTMGRSPSTQTGH